MVITLVFVSTSILISKQLNYVQNYNIGASMEQVVSVSGPTSFNGEDRYWLPDVPKITKFRTFKEQMLKKSDVIAGTASYDLFGKEAQVHNRPYWRTANEQRVEVRTTNLSVDNGFIETYGLKLLAGTDFPNSLNEYQQKVILNKTALKQLKFNSPEEAIGDIVQIGAQRQLEIVGVVDDFHFEGLKKEIYPIVLEFNHPSEFGYYSFKLQSANMTKTIKDIKSTWDGIYPNDPFNCFFQDEFYNQQYQADKRFSKFNLLFTTISIIICCLGLYSMINFFILRKTKEIGVRKVNGAKVIEVLALINKDFVIWVLFAFVIACPVSFMVMEKWLGSFVYQTNISWWIFAIAGFIALAISVITVSWQSWQAANRNPIEALRYE
ncbi:FtsX-like permease family protein [Bacteroidales bacterium]|nr:FtsX-like permease family protein [Bacteroidales bacterium]